MQTLDDHIAALAKRLKIVGIFFLVSTGMMFLISSDILSWIQADLGFELFALTAYETLYTQLMIAFLGGFLLSLPVTIYEIILFMKPGLKENEYKVLRNYLPFSIILFTIGSTFSYQFVVKTSLNFFQSITEASTVGAV
jgi:sec-independent protein translocase protein TatC